MFIIVNNKIELAFVNVAVLYMNVHLYKLFSITGTSACGAWVEIQYWSKFRTGPRCQTFPYMHVLISFVL